MVNLDAYLDRLRGLPPTNLYYNASTPTQWVDEYNSIYRAHWGRDLTYAEVLEQESETLVRYLLSGEADPWMFHQANLRAYDGVRSLLGDLLDVTLTKLEARLKVPVATPPASDIGRRFARRLDYDAAGVRATLFRGRALVIDAARPVSVPITGGRGADGEAYGGVVVRLVTVQPGTSTCVPLDDEGRGCDPAPVRAGGPGPTSALPIGVCDNGGTAVYAPAAGGVSVTPVPRGSSWRYSDRGGLDGAWRKPGFVDASWSTGPGPLGYGERYHATTVSYGASPTRKPITTYFRRSFTIPSVDAVIALRGEVMFDDGFVVYLNGIEIERSAMAGAPVSATTLSTVYETGNQYLSFDWTAHRRRLVTGTNTIAVEVHQASSDSNDLTFDLALLAEVKAAPAGAGVAPVGAGVAPVGAGVTPVGAGVATDAGVPVTPR